MKNPLIKAMRKNDPFSQMMQFMNGGGNPMQLVNQAMQSNPQAQQFMQMARQQCGNGSPKDFALNLFRKNGGDPQQLIQFAQRMGIE